MRSPESLRGILNPEWLQTHKQESAPSEPKTPIAEMEFEDRYFVEKVLHGSAAKAADLRSGDFIISIDGKAVSVQRRLAEEVQTWNGKAKIIQVLGADNAMREVQLQPHWDEASKCWTVGVGYIMERVSKEHEYAEKRVRYPFEIKNVEGKMIAQGYAILGKQEPSTEWIKEGTANGMQREIEKYIFFVPQKNGTTEEYDVIDRFNSANVKLYWRPDMPAGEAGNFSRRRETGIGIKNFTAPLAPHILIHELRHAYQEEQGMFDNLSHYYRPVIADRYDDPAAWTEKIRADFGLDNIMKILSHLFEEAEVKKLLAQFKEQWKGAMKKIREARKEIQKLQQSDKEMRQLFEDELRGTKKNIFKKHLLPLLTNEKFTAIRSGFFDGSDPLVALNKAHAFYEGRNIHNGDTDNETVQDAFQYIKSFFVAEEYNARIPNWPLLFDWDQSNIDMAAQTITLTRMHRRTGVRFEVGPEAVANFDEAMKSAKNEFAEVSRVLFEEEKIRHENFLSQEQTAQQKLQEAEKVLPDAQTPVIGSARVIDILRLPTLLVERDAEYGALIGLRAIKKETGIDLFQQFYARKETDNIADTIPEGLSKEKVPAKQIERVIESLRQIHSYMKKIGVPNGCLREIKVKQAETVASS